MKKIAVFLFVLVTLSLCAFAAETEYEIKLSYDEAKNAVISQVYINKGNSVAGHIGLSFNSEKLQIVSSDFSDIPAEIPEKSENGESYLCSVVKGASEYIIITPEMLSVKELVNEEKGYVLFGWYAQKDVDSIKAGESVAKICFRLAEGVSISDVVAGDITPVTKEKTADLSGWGSGIMVADAEGKAYFYEPEENANKLAITVKSDFFEAVADENDNKEENSEETKTEAGEKTEEKKDETGITEETVTGDTVKEQPSSTDMGMSVKTYSDRIRITWKKPEGFNVKEYRITVTDKDNYPVVTINGITDITRSFTVKNLAHDYDFKVTLAAVKPDGAVVYHNKVAVLKTSRNEYAAAKIYNVKYKAGAGTLYGMENEQVMFGSHPTKAPTVYAPEGYEFAGWSVDGKNVTNLEEFKVYADTVLTAVYTKEQ